MFKVSILCLFSPLITSLQLTRPPREVAAVVTVLSFWPVTLKNSNFVPSAPLLVRVNVLFKVSPITVVPKSIRHVSVDSCSNICFNVFTLIQSIDDQYCEFKKIPTIYIDHCKYFKKFQFVFLILYKKKNWLKMIIYITFLCGTLKRNSKWPSLWQEFHFSK